VLHEVIDSAQLCVSELVSNVITHVGHGTPATLAVSMRGTYLRIEVHDPDPRTLPTLMEATPDSESGRGMALVDAIADRWGVQLLADHKMTWCELTTTLTSPNGRRAGLHLTRAEEVLGLYGGAKPRVGGESTRLSAAMAKETAIGVIADLLHWLQAHGHDAEDALDRAQMHFEAETTLAGNPT
jgi:hypothetical protein